MHGQGYGRELVKFIQLDKSREIHVSATHDATNFYHLFDFKAKYRSARCGCVSNELKHLVWNFQTKKRRSQNQIVTPSKKPGKK
jgi:hypothetical protein